MTWMKADFHSLQMPTQTFGVSWSTKPPFRRALHCGRQRVFKNNYSRLLHQLIKLTREQRHFPNCVVVNQISYDKFILARCKNSNLRTHFHIYCFPLNCVERKFYNILIIMPPFFCRLESLF